MHKCLNCGTLSDTNLRGCCSIDCLKFLNNEVFANDAHVTIKNIMQYNEDEVPELDTMDKCREYAEYKAQFN